MPLGEPLGVAAADDPTRDARVTQECLERVEEIEALLRNDGPKGHVSRETSTEASLGAMEWRGPFRSEAR
jgi:hypothetical protein